MIAARYRCRRLIFDYRPGSLRDAPSRRKNRKIYYRPSTSIIYIYIYIHVDGKREITNARDNGGSDSIFFVSFRLVRAALIDR